MAKSKTKQSEESSNVESSTTKTDMSGKKKRKHEEVTNDAPVTKVSQNTTDSTSQEVSKREKKDKKWKKHKARKIKERKAAMKKKQAENFENRDSKNSTSYQLGIQYLHQWKNDQENWGFKKVRQVWLLQHIYHDVLMSDDDFDILLEYLDGLKGQGRDATLTEAETILKAFEAESDDEEESNEEEKTVQEKTETKKPSKEKYERARQIIQLLS